MISQTTGEMTVEIIDGWCEKNQVSSSEMIDLLAAIHNVSGNKSFRDSMNFILTEFKYKSNKGGA